MNIRENFKTALFCAVFPSVLGCILCWRSIMPEWYVYFAGVMFGISIISLIIPGIGCAIHKSASKTAGIIGNFVSRFILFFVWIFAVLPTGILMKIVKRDRLRLKKPDIKSYWVDNTSEKTDYEYQF